MKLHVWNHFIGASSVNAFAIAENVDEAREEISKSVRSNYTDLLHHVMTTEPIVYDKPHGWVQEVGAQYI